MSRLTRSLGPEISRQLLLPLRQLPTKHSPIEQLQRRFRLIIRHLMTRLINPREAEVAILPRLAVFDTVNEEGRVARLAELLAVLILRREGDSLATEPVTDIICVSVDESYAHRARENIF